MTLDNVIAYHTQLARKRLLASKDLLSVKYVYSGDQLSTWYEMYNKDVTQFKFHNQVKRTLKGVK